ncbi:MAG: riboflavin kinase, partial [Candidatus Peregrinibacteria bacterium]|nr:riboflavin kinase [Candidatus Peregrinibacteria bacterium]
MHFTAPVITGSGRGKKLGIPTLNLDTAHVPDTLEEGVYACFARLGENGTRVPAVMHRGTRPTFGDTPSCEVHVLNHIVAIAPRSLVVDVVEKIRDVQKFADEHA